jgi:hypothetical protein
MDGDSVDAKRTQSKMEFVEVVKLCKKATMPNLKNALTAYMRRLVVRGTLDHYAMQTLHHVQIMKQSKNQPRIFLE